MPKTSTKAQTFTYPLGKLVLVTLITSEEQDLGGLLAPVSSDESKLLKRAKVVAVGPEVTTVKNDDVVIVPKQLRNEITLYGIKHHLVHIEEILAYEKIAS
jgi:co-chaperonin GroES (HSP10)